MEECQDQLLCRRLPHYPGYSPKPVPFMEVALKPISGPMPLLPHLAVVSESRLIDLKNM